MNTNEPTTPTPEPTTPTPEPTTPTPTPSGGAGGGDSNAKVLAIVGYILPFLFFIPLLSDDKTNKFARFHANQQLLLLLFWVIGNIVSSLLMTVLIGFLVYPVVYVIGIIYMVLGIVNVANGEMKELPVLGKYQLIK